MEHALRVAHIDESSIHLGNGHHLYVVATSLTVSTDATVIEQSLRGLLERDRLYLRHYDEVFDRRLKIAQCIAGQPLSGAAVATARCEAKAQETARRQLLSDLLPRLQHQEAVDRIIIESRGGSDKADKRVIDKLRRSRHLTVDLKIDHATKLADPLPWIADFVAGCWLGAYFHNELEPWDILNKAHVIEVTLKP